MSGGGTGLRWQDSGALVVLMSVFVCSFVILLLASSFCLHFNSSSLDTLASSSSYPFQDHLFSDVMQPSLMCGMKTVVHDALICFSCIYCVCDPFSNNSSSV